MAQRIHPNDLLTYDLYGFACLLAVARHAGVLDPADPRLRRSMLVYGVSAVRVDSILDRAAAVWEDVDRRPPLSDPLTQAEADDAADEYGQVTELVVVDCDAFCDDPIVAVTEAIVVDGVTLHDVGYSVITAGPSGDLVVSVEGKLARDEDEDDEIDDTSGEEEPNPLAHGLTEHEALPDFEDYRRTRRGRPPQDDDWPASDDEEDE